MWLIQLMNTLVTLFWMSLFCLVVYLIVRALIFSSVRPCSGTHDETRWRKDRAQIASHWMLFASLATPFWLAFCHKLTQGPGSNAAPGFGSFLAGVLGFPCVVTFLATLKIWLDTRKKGQP